jgi:NADPH:quinone reductase-like Zn-dependent oxidoreductase
MKAVRFHQHGDASVLRYEDTADPAPRPGGVVVRVRACAMNHLDLWQRRGLERVAIPLPHISGAEVAGEILAVGDGVSDWGVGDRVMVQPGLSCGHCEACLSGRDNFCPKYDVLGYMSDGGYAERVAVPAVNLIRLPASIAWEAGAAFPLAFLTAWHMLFTRARLIDGETVLVVSAGSGVGQAAVQLAKYAHARVLATAGTADKCARAVALGAEIAVNHHDDDVVAAVKKATGGRGVDVVIEHVGVATWERSVRCLARGGRLVTCGATTGHEARLDLRHLFARQLSLLGSYMGGKGELLRAARLYFEGAVAPMVDRTFPLSDAAQAHRYLEESKHFGKVVLTV